MKKKIAILIVAALVLTAVPLVSAVVQTWYLSSTASGANYVMYKGSAAGGSGVVTVPQQDCVIWIANEAATCDVTFHAGDWTGDLTANRQGSNNHFTVDIGEWDGTNFISAGQYDDYFASGTASFTISASEFTVDEGNWLAFKLTNLKPKSGGSQLGIRPYKCDVSSPPSSPDYPVPELSTLILLSVGLLTLAGYVGLRRKKK